MTDFHIERIALLVHILCELRVSHGITAQKLKIAEQPSRRLISPMGRSRLLDELYTVRAAEEKFVEGLIGRSLQFTILPKLIKFLERKTRIPILKANLPDLFNAVNTQHRESNGHPPVDRRPSCERISQNLSMSSRAHQIWPARNMSNQHSITDSLSHQESLFYPCAASSSLILPQGLPCPARTTVHVPLDFSSFGHLPCQFSLPETFGDMTDFV